MIQAGVLNSYVGGLTGQLEAAIAERQAAAECNIEARIALAEYRARKLGEAYADGTINGPNAQMREVQEQYVLYTDQHFVTLEKGAAEAERREKTAASKVACASQSIQLIIAIYGSMSTSMPA